MKTAAMADSTRRAGRASFAARVVAPVGLLGVILIAAGALTAALTARSAATAQLSGRAEAVRELALYRLGHGGAAALERGVAGGGGTARLVAVASVPTHTVAVDRGAQRIYTYPEGTFGRTPAVLEVAVPTQGVDAAATTAAIRALEVGAALLALLLVALAFLLRRHVLEPLRRLSTAVERIRGGAYGERIDVRGPRPVRALAAGLEQITAVIADLDAQAATDSLTGVANRRFFHTALATELARAERESTCLTLVLLDLDGFKAINDTHGHPFGDGILQTIAGRLRATLRVTDVLARVGGDEFALLLPGMPADKALTVVERARSEAGGSVGGVDLTWCAGVACYPDDARDAATLLECADAALYCSKASGEPSTSRYDPDDVMGTRSASDRATLAALLKLPDAVRPVFQPLVSLATGRVFAYEALARFPHPPARRPDEWFAIARQCGLGPALEAYAIRAALAARGRPDGTQLAFNLSASALSSDDVLEALPEDLSDIVIEIGEDAHRCEPEVLIAQVAPLRARGARIAVDDAGAGYNGLQQLMRIRPDIVKLDRSLVAHVDSDPAKAALIDSLVRFARRTGAAVCAEGIETPEELKLLAGLDVAYGQGFGLARPGAPWVSVSAWVAAAIPGHDERRGAGSSLRHLAARLETVRDTAEIAALADLIAAAVGADEVCVLWRAPAEAALEALTNHSWLATRRLSLSRFATIRSQLSTAEPVRLEPGGDGGVAERALVVQSGHGSALLVPLVAQGEALGVLLCLAAAERTWSDNEIQRARIAADQLGSALDEILWAAVEVIERDALRVDAEVVIERREHLAELHRAILGLAAESIGRADHLPGPHPAARQQRA